MIFDKTLQFSASQAITADAASTNILDLRALGTAYGHAAALLRDLGIGHKVPLLVQVVEAFNTLTSLNIVLQGSVDEAFTSPVTIATENKVLADLVVGAQFNIDFLPRGTKYRYLRMYYDVVGTNPTLGKITAGIVAAVQPSAPGPY
jgi:hypothetical protein